MRREIWYRLKDDPIYNISMIPLVLMWGVSDESGTEQYYWKYNTEEMKKMLSRYNGTNNDAKQYGEEVYNTYLIFEKY